VLPTVNDIDNLKVLRMAVYLKMDMHIDNILKHLQLGFALRDVVTDFSLELRSGLDLRSVFQDTEFVLNDAFAMKIDGKVWGCALLATILHYL